MVAQICPIRNRGVADCELTFSRHAATFRPVSDLYHIVQLANGSFSLRSEAYGETFHPVVGPVAEAQALYVEQLRLVERVQLVGREFVVWDVGLGAAANPLSFLNAVREVEADVRVVSFDYTTEPLQMALQNLARLGYLRGWEEALEKIIQQRAHRFSSGSLNIYWELHLGDFPSFVRTTEASKLAKPDAIFYDAFSPATNPGMWTLGVFHDLFRLLEPSRPCVMPTYSRSTMLRVTLLLAGFYVGRGHATGEKEETTIASNTLSELAEPLGPEWLLRCQRSRSAEPLHTPEYVQAAMSGATLEKLRKHPQFQSA
jgi:tRNA U34 5-methylaminomethyl-2-thiouridine-forming methyltransferase MnmC